MSETLTVSNKIKSKVWDEYTKKPSTKSELKSIFLSKNPTDAYKKVSDKLKKQLDKESVSSKKSSKNSPKRSLKPDSPRKSPKNSPKRSLKPLSPRKSPRPSTPRPSTPKPLKSNLKSPKSEKGGIKYVTLLDKK